MGRPETAYCSHIELSAIQDSCHAYSVTIDDEMLLWTPAEARKHFESKGSAARPDVTGRSVTDKATALRKVGPNTGARDLWVFICCPCDGGLVSYLLDKRDSRRDKRDREARERLDN